MNNSIEWKELCPSDLPTLVLAIEVNPQIITNAPSFKSNREWFPFNFGREWLAIRHQTGGIAVHEHYLFASKLRTTQRIFDNMKALSDYYWASNIGTAGEPTLNSLIKYRQQLKEVLGVDCNQSYADFQEGYYPIDLEFISKLTTETLPNNLEDLLERSTTKRQHWEQFAWQWKLLILTENSD
ncbi:hypothetical protein ACQ4M3_20795 [Leptolyngbya sp. AN03gr2]